MMDDLLNQEAGTVHESGCQAGEYERSGLPAETEDAHDGAGMEGAAKLLAGQADAIRAQVLRHSTEHFMQRLAARIGADARSPAPVGYVPAGSAAMALDPYPAESGDIAQLSPPAATPAPHTLRPGGRARPRPRTRRRPTPINALDSGKSQYLAFGYVTQLCTTVLRSAEIETLAAFAADYDAAGARTFGCLLYSHDRRESAMYWWRFAAGAGDPLAAHLLAAHHAAIGPTTDSRAWIAFSVMLGFCPDRHVPRPVRHRTELAGSFASEIPTSDAARSFLRHRNLPPGLARL
ncbi:hypothetical protein JI76_01355 [Streptomyces anulatus]|nr:hypothetical protein JI76_01355 [Streptomyces anulatus]